MDVDGGRGINIRICTLSDLRSELQARLVIDENITVLKQENDYMLDFTNVRNVIVHTSDRLKGMEKFHLLLRSLNPHQPPALCGEIVRQIGL